VVGDVVVGDVETIGAGLGALPHPKRRTVAERVKTVARCLMSSSQCVSEFSAGPMSNDGVRAKPEKKDHSDWMAIMKRKMV
jgi:hypothetical protein